MRSSAHPLSSPKSSQPSHLASLLATGSKVKIDTKPEWGFGEVRGVNGNSVEVAFARGPHNWQPESFPPEQILRHLLPTETRCYSTATEAVRYGRVLSLRKDIYPLRTYLVRWGGEPVPVELAENEFSVRSYLPFDDAQEALSSLAQETPFFFEARRGFLEQLLLQNGCASGLTGLASSKIEMLPHQVEIASRALRDPIMRYLLADEVGLGKTIEAGIILRQTLIDVPETRAVVLVPAPLQRQWREELRRRFDITCVEVLPHDEILKWITPQQPLDMVIIDEAHRLFQGQGTDQQLRRLAAKNLAKAASSLLLLSATPVLHSDAELLSLLSLLDPVNYSMEDLQSFRARTALRADLGRALLALRSASGRAFIKRSSAHLAHLLPADATVQSLAVQAGAPEADVDAIRNRLHLHVSETYRIHRRMLRTRRRWLAEAEHRFVRDVNELPEHAVNDETHAALWRTLEEWRSAVAARVIESPQTTALCAAQYLRLAHAISAEPDTLSALVANVVIATKSTDQERRLLQGLMAVDARPILEARSELIQGILTRQFRQALDGPDAKYVIFCPSPNAVARTAETLRQLFGGASVVTADASMPSEEAGLVFSEFAENSARVLLTDATGEEGFNLQFARGVIFQDLPWSPMRIEQRIGRLDRIDHSGRINCFPMVTGEDDLLNVDEAWRRLLSEGFRVFQESVSDLQHLIDKEMPHLTVLVFQGGPQALVEEIHNLGERVRVEREAIAEQDIIDGVHGFSAGSEACRNLKSADRSAEDFGRALTSYIEGNIRLKQRWDDETNSFTFYLPRDTDPIVPSDRLADIDGSLNMPATVRRDVAIKEPKLQFLRPGHKAVDGCLELLMWDDRGRAFALWRRAPGNPNPVTVFRCVVHIRVDLAPVKSRLDDLHWDQAKRASLLRLARSWLPARLQEFYLDPEGHPAPTTLINLCRRPYNKDTDVSLGKDRAKAIRALIGIDTWRRWCTSAVTSAISQVKENADFQRFLAGARRSATEHFSLADAQITARQSAGLDTPRQCEDALQEMQALGSLVEHIIADPKISLDSFGAYFLSERPLSKDGV